MASAGHFQSAKASGSTYEVAMNAVVCARFEGDRRCIGTEELNGCTVVTIVSPQAAIMAHIAPRPDVDPLDLHAGDRNASEKMAEVGTLYHENRECFPPGRTTLLVNAMYEDEVALPSQKAIIEDRLRALGLTYNTAAYFVFHGRVVPPKGTVFVDARGTRPVIYVEDYVCPV